MENFVEISINGTRKWMKKEKKNHNTFCFMSKSKCDEHKLFTFQFEAISHEVFFWAHINQNASFDSFSGQKHEKEVRNGNNGCKCAVTRLENTQIKS